ncbi:esterase-like activity of phytase family protein [Zestomonas thermotolerans]|uniref:esterase-like activity of phytase family protein n=1 Tax=Zestomonas thermotolerans TaxID=157784 RepID=UPI00036CA1E1|nr:esterase-like activity of phytase family protein [Pseudomonas thermotolerans]
MIRIGLAALLLVTLPAFAAPVEELRLEAEYPVADMPVGNLSGLAWCGDALWAVSDRDDDRLYRLRMAGDRLVAEAEVFTAPPPDDSRLPWGIRTRNWVAAQVRGGALDFEGLSCDAEGNRYLVSEAQVGVLRLPAATSQGEWLVLPAGLLRQARASGMLLKFNALLEGIAVSPDASRLWLAAERERRGLLALQREQNQWLCAASCVLFSEGGKQAPPPQLDVAEQPRDFSDLVFFAERLFTLERQGYRICRRDPADGAVERCWSFAEEALQEPRRYGRQAFGRAEGLELDEQGAWIGLDTGGKVRNDGETRPIVWRFAAPAGGWSAP